MRFTLKHIGLYSYMRYSLVMHGAAVTSRSKYYSIVELRYNFPGARPPQGLEPALIRNTLHNSLSARSGTTVVLIDVVLHATSLCTDLNMLADAEVSPYSASDLTWQRNEFPRTASTFVRLMFLDGPLRDEEACRANSWTTGICVTH